MEILASIDGLVCHEVLDYFITATSSWKTFIIRNTKNVLTHY